MKYSELNEIKARGTPDFPIELYRIDSEHSRYIMPFHWHSEFEIIRVEEGEFHVIIGEEEHKAQAGDVLVVNAGLIHGGVPQSCVYHCIVFDLTMLFGRSNSGWINDLRRITGYKDSLRCYHPADSGEISTLVAHLIKALRRPEKGGRLSALGALYTLFGLLADELSEASESHGREHYIGDVKMKAVLDWIEENYAETVTLDDLAGVAGMNPKYFCEFFKRYTRRSPIDYLNMYRIDSACRMLKVSRSTITETAFSCGFNDLSYFVKTFKKYKGLTPRQYRRQFELDALRDHIGEA